MTEHETTPPADLAPTLAETARRRADLHHALIAVEAAISSPAIAREDEWAKDVVRELQDLGHTIAEHI